MMDASQDATVSSETRVVVGRGTLMARVRKNVTILLSGNAMSQLIGFVGVAVNARALGVDGLGTLALLQAITAMIGRVFAFDTWQPVVKLGAPLLTADEREALGVVASVGLTYDAAASLVSTIVATLLVTLAGPQLGLTGPIAAAALFWVVVTLGIGFSGGAGAAVGLMRLLNAFGWLSFIQIATAICNLLASVVLWRLDASLSTYIAVFAVVLAASQWAVLVIAIAGLKRRGVKLRWLDLGQDRVIIKEFNAFAWSSSSTSLINAARQNIDVFVLGVFAGPASVGVYSVAKKLANVVNIVAEAGRQSVFLETSTLISRGDTKQLRAMLSHLAMIGAAMAAACLAATLLFGQWGLRIAFGDDFSEGFVPLSILIASSCVYLIGFPLGGVVQSTAGPAALAGIFAVSFVVSTPIGLFAIYHFHLLGAGLGQLVFMISWFSGSIFVAWKHLNKMGATKNEIDV